MRCEAVDEDGLTCESIAVPVCGHVGLMGRWDRMGRDGGEGVGLIWIMGR